MAETKFTISLELDGADVKRQAAQIKKQFERALTESFTLNIGGVGGQPALKELQKAVQETTTAGASAVEGMVKEINQWLQRIDPGFFGSEALVDRGCSAH